jgi:hypothetical protein
MSPKNRYIACLHLRRRSATDICIPGSLLYAPQPTTRTHPQSDTYHARRAAGSSQYRRIGITAACKTKRPHDTEQTANRSWRRFDADGDDLHVEFDNGTSKAVSQIVILDSLVSAVRRCETLRQGFSSQGSSSRSTIAHLPYSAATATGVRPLAFRAVFSPPY